LLKEHVENYQNLVNSLFETVSVLDSQGNFLFANSMAAKNMTGESSPPDISGKNLGEFLSPSQVDALMKQYRQIIAADKARVLFNIVKFRDAPYTVTGRRKDGSTFIAELEAKNVKHQGKTVRIAALRDVTENKEAEKELIAKNKELTLAKEKAEESDRLKSAFLTNMSHEIRTPMNSILGFAELLKEPDLTGEEKQKFVEAIQKSGSRMLTTINDYINFLKFAPVFRGYGLQAIPHYLLEIDGVGIALRINQKHLGIRIEF